MKKIMICALAAVMLAACSKHENGGDAVPEGEVAIRLSAGVPSAAVTPDGKAPIVENDQFTAGVAGWETTITPTYAAETWKSTAADIKANTVAQNITLSPVQVYNASNDIKTFIKAWYPAGTLSNGIVTFDNATGEVDAMLAATVSGSKRAQVSTPLAFAHKTTQLVFKVAGEKSLAAGTTLTSITVKNVQKPVGFDLTKEVAETGSVTFAAQADLTVPGISTPAIPIATDAPATPLTVGKPVMVKPLSGNSFNLDIETSNAEYKNVTATIDTDSDFAEGKAYTITLTFKQTGISPKATVADWTTGTGTGDVE